MIGRLMTWVRRNSRRAVALAVAPGLVMLGVDAGIEHFAGTGSDNVLQLPPIVYGLAGALLVAIACVPRSRTFFAWMMWAVGASGVVIGLLGTWFHVEALLEELGGDYGMASLEGGLSVAPPLFAPLGFTALGALLMILPSRRLLLRLRLGRVGPHTGGAQVVKLPASGSERQTG